MRQTQIQRCDHRSLVMPADYKKVFPFQTYRYDRFLNEDGSVKRDFYKGGKRLKYYTMPWGAGTNGCVGKQFAINTMRQ